MSRTSVRPTARDATSYGVYRNRIPSATIQAYPETGNRYTSG